MNVDNWKSLIIKRLLELGSCTNDELFVTFAKHFDTDTHMMNYVHQKLL